MAEGDELALEPVANGTIPNGTVAGTEGEAAQNEEQPAPPQNQTTFMSVVKGLLLRAVIIYMVSSFFKRGSPPPANQEGTGSTITALPSSNIWANGTMFDLYVYFSELEKGTDHFRKAQSLLWKEEDLMYGDWTSGPDADGLRYFNGTITPSEAMMNNGTIYLHVYVVISGKTPDPSQPHYAAEHTIYRSKQLNRYRRKIYKQTHNLLTGETEQSMEDQEKAQTVTYEVLSFWHPNLTINVVDDHTPWVQGKVPKPIDEHVEFDPITGKYYPIVYMNDYWNLMRDYYPINNTLEALPLFITFQPLSLFRWQIYVAQSMRNSMMSSFMGASAGDDSLEDQDQLKEALLETNPYLLGMTVAVSILHSLFEFLAFKNDIQFWRERKSLEGLSVRSVFFNVFQSLIVFLYIIDNDANTIVKISVFVGMCIECWKVKKVVNIKVDREQRSLGGLLPFKVVFEDKGTYVESSTKQYDIMAFKYLSWLLFPLVVCYCGYSLMYQEHKGWWSWSISMVYGFLLTFGFIMMTPQLFINYKLKSVAHLPWRMLTYKFLNTFIDDIFAFVIKMPMMYRIGCFRDDIVFLVYVYQRWIYRVDPRRVNEFGTSQDDDGRADQAEGVNPVEGGGEPARIKQD